MFTVFTYVQIVFCVGLICASPFIAVGSRKHYKAFGIIWFELYFSQLFMYAPGADVSPYSFAHSQLEQIRFWGLTLSAFVSITLLFFIICKFFFWKKRIKYNEFLLLVFAIAPYLISLLFNNSIIENLDYFMKMIAPFIVAVYALHTINVSNIKYFKRMINLINMMLIGQVFICRIIYGHFAAHNYYFEMEEEYFGYYNHPHSFTGLLGILAIWNIYQINKRDKTKFNLILFILNVILMYISGVRTYVVALCAGLAFIGLDSIRLNYMKTIRKYVYAVIVLLAILGPSILSNFAADRNLGDISSGRIERWVMDISYVVSNGTIFDILFGGGLKYIEKVNAYIFGVEVNSLNVFIDNFANCGIIGMISITIAYFLLHKITWNQKARGFQRGVLVTFFVAAFINNITIYITIMSMIVILLVIFKVDNEVVNSELVP